MPELPTGTVTFLFTDIEGSTRLLRELGEGYGAMQDEHARIIRTAVAAQGGIEVRTIGDAFFVVFPTAAAALRAAAAAQRALAPTAWPGGETLRVRMGLHTGEGQLGGDDYLGVDVNRTARIAAAGHGGQILLSEATRVLGANDLPEGVAVRDLGPHRLKDFAEPQAIHQLVIDGLPSNFPALRTLDVPTNLPPDLTSFVGRGEELLAVEQALEASRLVTLTGPGGSGKTRLALRAAADLAERFPGGVFFVDLSNIAEARLVPDAIAEAVGTGEQGPRSVLETLELELRDRTMLLVLDNLEQVLDAAPWIGTLLSTLPKLDVLATSRGPLRIRGEHELPIPPLGLPEGDGPIAPEDVQGFEAVRLFLDRATAIDPSFTLTPQNAAAIVEICRRLDGLPLAIELAASRLRILAPEAMLERLDRALPWLGGSARDLPARQRTLRGAIGWSYDLLSESVATLFRRLCVFAGGCSLEAATAVGDPDGELDVDPLDGVEALLDGGLLRRRTTPGGEIRFDTLQTVREFGLERLTESGEGPAVRDRHAAYFLALAEAAEPESRGPELLGWLRGLAVDHDNYRAALGWAVETDQGDLALRLVRALWRFWHLHGDLTSGREWAAQALGLPSAAGRTRARARAQNAAGSLAYWQQDHPVITASYEEALAIARELGDRAVEAEALYNLAFARSLVGEVADAEGLFRESRAIFEDLGDRRGVGDALFGLSITLRIQGDLAAARASAERALELSEEALDMFGVHGSLYVVGRAAAEMGDFDVAREDFLRTLGMAAAFGDRTGIALSLDNLADEEIRRGHAERGLRLAGAASAIKESVAGQAPPELVRLPDPRATARPQLSEAALDEAWEAGRKMDPSEAIAFARQLS